MAALRQLLLEGDKTAKAAVQAVAGQDRFRLEGEEYKRPKHPGAPGELRPWVNRKELYLSCRGSDPDFLYAPELGKRVAEQLAALKPVYQLFWKAQDTARAQAVRPSAAAGDW